MFEVWNFKSSIKAFLASGLSIRTQFKTITHKFRYRIDFNESEFGGPPRTADSSSDEEDDKPHKMPIIQIDMKNYGY